MAKAEAHINAQKGKASSTYRGLAKMSRLQTLSNGGQKNQLSEEEPRRIP